MRKRYFSLYAETFVLVYLTVFNDGFEECLVKIVSYFQKELQIIKQINFAKKRWTKKTIKYLYFVNHNTMILHISHCNGAHMLTNEAKNIFDKMRKNLHFLRLYIYRGIRLLNAILLVFEELKIFLQNHTNFVWKSNRKWLIFNFKIEKKVTFLESKHA